MGWLFLIRCSHQQLLVQRLFVAVRSGWPKNRHWVLLAEVIWSRRENTEKMVLRIVVDMEWCMGVDWRRRGKGVGVGVMREIERGGRGHVHGVCSRRHWQRPFDVHSHDDTRLTGGAYYPPGSER